MFKKPFSRSHNLGHSPVHARRGFDLATGCGSIALALGLALVVGCASQSRHNDQAISFTPPTTPIAAAVSERQAANIAVGRALYEMFLNDGRYSHSMVASVDDGVVTLTGILPSGLERKKLSDRIRALPGVKKVQYEDGTPVEGMARN
jgi:hypothetical protein